jgi:hypothetical protein
MVDLVLFIVYATNKQISMDTLKPSDILQAIFTTLHYLQSL